MRLTTAVRLETRATTTGAALPLAEAAADIGSHRCNRTRVISFLGVGAMAGGADTRDVASQMIARVSTMLPLKPPMISVIAAIRRATEDHHKADKTRIQAATSQLADNKATRGTRSGKATKGGATFHKNATNTRISRNRKTGGPHIQTIGQLRTHDNNIWAATKTGRIEIGRSSTVARGSGNAT